MSSSQVSTNVASSSSRPSISAGSPRAGSNVVRHRVKPVATSRSAGPANSSGFLGFANDDTPGIKVGPVPVIVSSLSFIAVVFILHIVNRYFR